MVLLYTVPASAASRTYYSDANGNSEQVTYVVTVTPTRTGKNTATFKWSVTPSWTGYAEGHGSPTAIYANISTTAKLASNGKPWSRTINIKSSGSNTLNAASGTVKLKNLTRDQTTIPIEFYASASGSYVTSRTVYETYYETYYNCYYMYANSNGTYRSSYRGTYSSPCPYSHRHNAGRSSYLKDVPYTSSYTVSRTVYDTHWTNSGYLALQSFDAGTMEKYFFVTYNSVGGTKPPARQGFIGGSSVKITSSYPRYTYPDAKLTTYAKGWSTKEYEQGKGTVNYPGGKEYKTKKDLTLYAVYPQRYSITYDTLSGSPETPKQWFIEDKFIKLTTENLPKYKRADIGDEEAYSFVGWSKTKYALGEGQPDGNFDPGDKYSTNANLKLYAVVTPNMIGKIVYHANGGNEDSVPPQQEKYYNVDVNLSTVIPTHPDTENKGQRHIFKCWNTKADGTGYSYKAGDLFTLNANPHEPLPQTKTGINLYAIWVSGDDPNSEEQFDSTLPNIRYIDKEHKDYLTEGSKWKTGVRQTELNESLNKDGQPEAKRSYDSRGNLIVEH